LDIVTRLRKSDPSIGDTLDFTDQRIGDAGAALLAHAMQHSTGITYLLLCGNAFTHVGVAALLPVLQGISVLDLSDNPLGEQVGMLCTALQGCTMLQVLRLRGIGIGEAGASDIANLLERLDSLVNIDLGSAWGRVCPCGGGEK
jgi:hypothetical protein